MFTLTCFQIGCADDNLPMLEPSEYDKYLIKEGVVDQSYKIINMSKVNDAILKRKYIDKEMINKNKGVEATYTREDMTNFKQVITFLNINSSHDVGSSDIAYINNRLKKMIGRDVCVFLSKHIHTRINPYALNVIFEARDGSIIDKTTLTNADCHWEDYYYVLAKKSKKMHGARYRIRPNMPNFEENELHNKKIEFEFELLVDENGDVEQIDSPKLYLDEESDEIYQRIKAAFLNAKFHPYIENGQAKPFLVKQPIKIEGTEGEPLIPKILKNIFGKK